MALTATGTKALPNDGSKLWAILEDVAVRGLVLMVVGRAGHYPGLYPSLSPRQKPGVEVAYLPGPATRRTTDLHPGSAKTEGSVHQRGGRMDDVAVADLLTRYPIPARLASAGRGYVRARLKKHAPRLVERLTEEIFTALPEQTVVVLHLDGLRDTEALRQASGGDRTRNNHPSNPSNVSTRSRAR